MQPKTKTFWLAAGLTIIPLAILTVILCSLTPSKPGQWRGNRGGATASGDLYCSQCGMSHDKAEEEAEEEEYDGPPY